ncbi:MAG: hypothetical protein Q9166_000905 [cf. Caloplaca sp. 2 TL-2023]
MSGRGAAPGPPIHPPRNPPPDPPRGTNPPRPAPTGGPPPNALGQPRFKHVPSATNAYFGPTSIINVQQDGQAGRKCSSGLQFRLHLCARSGNQLAHDQDPGSGSTASL